VVGRASPLAPLVLASLVSLAGCGGKDAAEDAPALLGSAIPMAAPSAVGVDLPSVAGAGAGSMTPPPMHLPKLPTATPFSTPLAPAPAPVPAPPPVTPGAGAPPGGMQL